MKPGLFMCSRFPFVFFLAVAVCLNVVILAYCSEEPSPAPNSPLSETAPAEPGPGSDEPCPAADPSESIPADPGPFSPSPPSAMPAAQLLALRSLERLSPQENRRHKRLALASAVAAYGNPSDLLSVYEKYNDFRARAAASGMGESEVPGEDGVDTEQTELECLLESLSLLYARGSAAPPLSPITVSRLQSQLHALQQPLTGQSMPDNADSDDSANPEHQDQSMGATTPTVAEAPSSSYLTAAREHLRRSIRDLIDNSRGTN